MPGTTIAAGAAEDAIDEALAAVRFLDAYERTDVLDDGTDVEQVHRLAFDRYARADVSVEANAESLARTFVEACADRAAVVDETVVSLSGGLDSRAVLAAYDHAEGDLVAATSANEGGSNAREVAVAREVAEAVGVEWQPYVASASDAGRRRLLDMHQGMTHLDTVLGADFVEQVAADHPAAMFVTGDGGDKALPDLTPAASPDSVADLVSTLVTTLARFDLAEAAALAGVRPDDLRASIRERVESYPEADLDARYAHFLVRERGINQLNHGEERSRYFVWSTSPFYSLPFFTQAMACPPAQKRRSRLYRSFLETLSPAAVGVDYVDFGAPIDSLEYRAKKVAYDAIADRPALLSGVKRLLGRGDGDTDPEASTAITDALREGGPETAPLSRPAIQRVAWNGGKYSARQQYIVLTLLGAFSSGDGGRTVEAA
jgi:asparagine synthase (glutamine-hydrolysing)